MQRVGASELRRTLFDVLDEVRDHDGSFVVMRGDQPVAVLSPAHAIKPEVNKKKLAAFCRKHGLKSLSLFGSILRDDFRSDSDVDVLVEPGRRYGYSEHCDMQDELEALFARRVDLVNAKVLREHYNEIRREEIFTTAQRVCP